jgi:hypothetical protein
MMMMMMMMSNVESASSFANAMQDLARWRKSVAASVTRLRDWIRTEQAQSEDQLASLEALLEQLQDDKLRLAFVAEFSRGKSELINAMFFSNYRGSLLPSSVGTTTQCPTELLYDAAEAPCIKLLPIETREMHTTLSALKKQPEAWTHIALDFKQPVALASAFQHLTETLSVRVSQAINYGLYHPDATSYAVAADGTVKVPRWRHAIINFAHPLLENGLVILDTPGLNAIGTEPELTINLIPETHAVVFVLSIDTGVTKSDLDIWHQCVRAEGAPERVALVALNKIDALWDDALPSAAAEGALAQAPRGDAALGPARYASEIQRQVASCAQILLLPQERILPLSAKKALIARQTGNSELLARSQLPQLEAALGERLIPARRKALQDKLATVVKNVIDATTHTLEERRSDHAAHTEELRSLRGKNEQLVTHLAESASRDKKIADNVGRGLHNVKRIIGGRLEQIFAQVDMEDVRVEIDRTRRGLLVSAFSHRMHQSVTNMCESLQRELADAGHTLTKIHDLALAQRELFTTQYGAKIAPPLKFPVEHYAKSVERLRGQYQQHFQSVLTLLLNRRSTLVAKSFEALAKGIDDIFLSINRDLRLWSKDLLAPLNAFVAEREQRLRYRLGSMKKLSSASGDLASTIADAEATQLGVEKQLMALEDLSGDALKALAVPDVARAAQRSVH